jgi:hypothetical protein
MFESSDNVTKETTSDNVSIKSIEVSDSNSNQQQVITF